VNATGTRRRRADGERSRNAILDTAAKLSTVEGLEGMSIGRLAEATGMSKSGLYAHFRSKEELQLATIEAAGETFETEVLSNVEGVEPGVGSILALSEAFLSYLERRVFPGGCFFAALTAEFGPRSGAVKERIVEYYDEWLALFEELVVQARDRGELAADVDPVQLAFELDAILYGANALFVLKDDERAFDHARRAIRERLDASR
jgi:AcrR family transcriptional regulator